MNNRCFGKLPAFFLAIMFFLVSLVSYSQSFYNTTKWRFSNPKQFGFAVIDMDFFDNNNGIAVGANGGIAYTKNGGTTWSYGNFSFINQSGLQTSTSFQDVHFVSATTAYAVGSNGCMAKTTDGGVTWNRVNNPLFANARNINTVWFLNENKGYIGGQHNNTPDLTPKLYFTLNGGATWDSIAAPVGGKTRVGYVNNPVGSFLWDINAKDKELYRIMFWDDNTGYICGSGLSTFEPIPNVSSTSPCNPTGTNTSTGSHHASLLWKFSNGTLTDYSISKERLGYNGIYTTLPGACNYRYASNSVHTQTYKAMHIIDANNVLLVSSNNNIVVRVNTAPGAITPNINAPGVNEAGTYQLLNAPFPPQNNSATQGAPIPANPVFGFLNPMNIVKASNGKLIVPVLSATFGPQNSMWTSTNNGTTWNQERWLPSGRNYSEFGGQAIDILPSGRVIIAGQNGVIADSTSGSPWASTYVQGTTGAFNKMDIADCNNIIAAGGGVIARTNDGGKTWNQVVRQDFINLNININSVAYATGNPAKAYFATSVGNIYRTTDMNVAPPAQPTIDPVYSLSGFQMWDVATSGNDSVWVCGYTPTPSTAQVSRVFRSTNGGNTWTQATAFPSNPSATNYLLRHIEFPTNLVGYVSGTRDTIWKTTDGGVTWNKLPLPTPGVTPQITYNDMFALNANTVFLVGNGFPRKAIFRTTDGGNTWQDITGNALAIFPVGNFNSVVFHDLNNGYIGCAGGFLVTNDGGASWRIDQTASSTNHTSIGFAPKRVPAGTPAANRRLFSVGVFSNHILEYGDTTNLNVSSSELMVSSCSNLANGNVTVTATGGIPPYTYSIDGGAFQSSGTFNSIGAGNHTITIRDFACGLVTKSITVPVRPAPSVSAGPDKTIVEGDEVMLQGSSTGSPASVVWTPNNTILSAGNTLAPVVRPMTTTTYTMTVTDANGCIAADNAQVTVLPYCLKVMNAFTPNGDGTNDRWIVTNNGGLCVTNVYVTVFNRYGSEVYVNPNYQNNWDGTYKGNPVPDGTYYYVINYTLLNGRKVTVKGDVTILR
jgi:gliding motility-associated-like protein